jgi:hypothetical protein
MATYTVHIHEDYGRLVEEGVGEVARLDHSSGLSFEVFSVLAHRAWHLADLEGGDTIQLHLENNVVFHCAGAGCVYG